MCLSVKLNGSTINARRRQLRRPDVGPADRARGRGTFDRHAGCAQPAENGRRKQERHGFHGLGMLVKRFTRDF